MYIHTIGAGQAPLNWSLIGAVLLVLLFIGSSHLTEAISREKYPLYTVYQQTVSKFIPGKTAFTDVLAARKEET